MFGQLPVWLGAAAGADEVPELPVVPGPVSGGAVAAGVVAAGVVLVEAALASAAPPPARAPATARVARVDLIALILVHLLGRLPPH
jgi:hypothetical protein